VTGEEQPLVLVTGASGKIGRHVVSELRERGYGVRAVTSKAVPDGVGSVGIEWRQLDFHRSLDFDPLVQGCVAVLHLAAEITAVERMQRSNVEATRALAQACERAGVRFLGYTSSVAVYGSSRRGLVTEDSPVLTHDHDVPSEYWAEDYLRCYGRTKLQGELAIREVANSVERAIVRPTVVVDTSDLLALSEWSTVTKQRAAARHAHHIYVRDVADALVWLMEQTLNRDDASSAVRVFNLSEDHAAIRTYGQLFDSAYKATGDKRWRLLPLPGAVEWLWVILKRRRLILRQPFGRTLFSGDRLIDEGYKFRFGMSHAITEFCGELASRDSGQGGVGHSTSAGGSYV
jgi:nucleoside-diphosphate-sugar epimerase